MISLSVKSNLDTAIRQMWWMHPDAVKLAAAKALTFTALAIRDAEKAEMQRVFDRPTPFTLNSLYVKTATPIALTARVWFKGIRGDWHYLIPQVEGGDRRLKMFEKHLQRAGILPVGMFVVPGAGLKLDQYGNIPGGKIVQLLSAVQALPEVGYLANKSRRRGARRNRKTDNIFAGRPHPGMPLGVWQRSLSGLKPLIVFVKRPQYRKRFDFYGIARNVAEREFNNQFLRALRSASSAVGVPLAAAA